MSSVTPLMLCQEETEARRDFADSFTDVLRALYDAHVVGGTPILQWADENEQDEDDEKGETTANPLYTVYVFFCGHFSQW